VQLDTQQHSQQADRAAQSSKQLMSQAQLSQLLQQQLGYSLSVRPSDIAHEDAGKWNMQHCNRHMDASIWSVLHCS
jgi:hypothetical protein